MNTMVERVRDVIWHQNPGHLTWEQADKLTRAAIAAMREPTEEMLKAIPIIKWNEQPYEKRDNWRAMIDAALQDGAAGKD